MGSKLYVGGLPYSVTGDRLQEIFAEHGTVESANVISDKFTGQSRGFGFVEMARAAKRKRRSIASMARSSMGALSRSMKRNRWASVTVSVAAAPTVAEVAAIAMAAAAATAGNSA